MTDKITEKPLELKRKGKKDGDDGLKPTPPAVSQGNVGQVVDIIMNASREKMREVTIINQWEGILFPLLDMVNTGMSYFMEIATYRESPDDYQKVYQKECPEAPDFIGELLYRTAQWRRSVKGALLNDGKDFVLAQLETQTEQFDKYGGDDGIHS